MTPDDLVFRSDEADPTGMSFVTPAARAVPEPRSVPYSVPCTRSLYDAAAALAHRTGVEVADLVRMVLTLVAPAVRGRWPDPGSGLGVALVPPPVVKLFLPSGLDHSEIRRALSLALALNTPDGVRLVSREEQDYLSGAVDKLRKRNRTLRLALERLSFRPLPDGPQTVAAAAAVLGLCACDCHDEALIATRFREMARLYHPDAGPIPCKERMGQLIMARNVLVQSLRRRAANG